MSAPRILVVDNVDSFTFMLVDYLATLGAEVVVKRNDALSVSDAVGCGADGILISPGPGTPDATPTLIAPLIAPRRKVARATARCRCRIRQAASPPPLRWRW